MNPNLLDKLDQLRDRHEEIHALLSDPDTINDQDTVSQACRWSYAQHRGRWSKAFNAYRELAQEGAGVPRARWLDEDDAEIAASWRKRKSRR